MRWRRNARWRRFSPPSRLFVLGYIGLAISTFPYIVPTVLTICASRGGAVEPGLHADRHVVLLPFILGYTALTYWLFRGKVAEGAAYH